jgi:RsiW-degrading membrane proteinase PrsW (M82 family)
MGQNCHYARHFGYLARRPDTASDVRSARCTYLRDRSRLATSRDPDRAGMPDIDVEGQIPQAVRQSSGNQQPAEIGTLLTLTALFAVLSTGVLRNWHWTFWLILVVFLVGIVRVPAAVLQFTGRVPWQGPVWYVVLQAGVGLLQFAIALAMLAGYRKAGLWGAR